MLRKDHFYKGLWSRGLRFLIRYDSVPQPRLDIVSGIHECHTCGLFQRVEHLGPGQVALCMRCDGPLVRHSFTSNITAPLVFCIASVTLYLALLVSALMTLDVYGRENTVTLLSGPLELARQGFVEVGMLVALATVLMPGVVLVLMGLVLYGCLCTELPLWVGPCLAWYERLRSWSMIEVYVIGVLVAYTKLVDIAVVVLQPGVFLLGGLMLMMAAMDSTFDASFIWQHRSVDKSYGLNCYDGHTQSIPAATHMLSCSVCQMVFLAESAVPHEHDMGDCPRCGQVLRRRKRESMKASLAFVLAALFFYIPANVLPVMTYIKVGQGKPNTIISGVIELWHSDLYFLALLVLFASIIVPVLKIFSLFFMLYSEVRNKSEHLRLFSKIYRLVLFIGRWSMIDVFMISILVAVVRFSFLAHVSANLGVVFFALVVVLTILAADLYDPRCMWDSAGKNNDAALCLLQDEQGEPIMIDEKMEPERP